MRTDLTEFAKRTSIVILIALVPVLLWLLFDVILIGIGAILVALLLSLGAEPLVRFVKIPSRAALVLSGLAIISMTFGAAYLFGTEVGSGLQEVLARTEEARKAILTPLQRSELGSLLLSRIHGVDVPITEVVSRAFNISTSLIGGLLVTVFAGIYLAAQPSLYRNGLSKLFPPRWRAAANETIDSIGSALRLWFLGQLLQMLIIGLVSTLAVWLVGLPSPLVLGLIAGFAEFVPYIGPIVASVPAILVASTVNLDAALWTIIAYILIHQAEGQIVAPLIQQRMVFIPPALMLMSIVALSLMFGTKAIFVAAPLTVVMFVLVSKLYVRDSLDEDVTLPGDARKRDQTVRLPTRAPTDDRADSPRDQ